MNAFTWVLAIYPLYLLINGRLTNYVAFASKPATQATP